MILSIDQGTTGTTCLVVDDRLEVVGRGYRELSQSFPQPGWVEHDPAEIWQAVLVTAEAALADAGRHARDLRAIGITNQRETTVVWDRITGRPLHPAIVWQDRRTAAACAALPAELIRERTGLVPDPYFSASKLRWLLDRVGSPELAFGTIDSWLVWNLTRGGVHAVDRTNASRTLLYSLRAGDWDPDLLDLFGIDPDILPRIVPSAGHVGDAELLGATIPICGIAGDQHAALFGQGCVVAGQCKATYGTGAFVLTHTGDDCAPPPFGLLRTTAAQPDAFALEGAVFVAGAALQWLRDGLGVIDSAAESEALARSVDSTEGVAFVPALTGLGSPWWDAEARGMISGITRGTTRAHLVRAGLEAIAHQVRDVIDAGGEPPSVIRADGGAVANRFLMQLQADLVGAPVEVSAEPEMTGIGAAALAGIGAGVWNSAAEVATLHRSGERFEPTMHRDHADALHDAWLTAVSRARGE